MNPNMDEVVRQVKEAVEMREKADIYEQRKSTEWLRLLIEEREQDKAEIERLKREAENLHKYKYELINEVDRWKNEAFEQDKEIQTLIAFAKSVIQTALDGNDLDGGQIQELGIKHGLINEEPYDPDIHGEDFGFVFAPGDPFYVYSDILKIK